jgi:ribosomal protein L11 methyltransferase
LGSDDVDAIDIDNWAYENTQENITRNSCHHIDVIQGGAEAIPGEARYDVVLANINRNILTRDMEQYVGHMSEHSQILFSGFYTSDKPEIEECANGLGLKLESEQSKGEWCMLRYLKN